MTAARSAAFSAPAFITPSGNLKPSEADKNVWKRLNEACIIMGLENLDNLIITPNKEYYSQVDDRLLL